MRVIFLFNFVIMLGLAGVIQADNMSVAANPYTSIVVRNIFSLVPMPTNPPPDVKPIDPPSKITPNGIMSLFGQLQVLFKVAEPAKAGKPAQDQSYVMSEGERQDDIEVTKIDEQAGMITFNNHGVVQQLPLISSPNLNTSPASSGPGPNPNMMRPAWNGRRNAPIPPPSDPPPGYNPSSGGGNSRANNFGGAGNASAGNANNSSSTEHLTPEAQVIMMESQRAQLLDQGDTPDMSPAIIPPTPLTPQVTGVPDPNPDSAPAPNPGAQ
jgi:hypothetical protein